MLCYKYLSFFLPPLEHLFFPEEYAIAFNTTKSYLKIRACMFILCICIHIAIIYMVFTKTNKFSFNGNLKFLQQCTITSSQSSTFKMIAAIPFLINVGYTLEPIQQTFLLEAWLITVFK